MVAHSMWRIVSAGLALLAAAAAAHAAEVTYPTKPIRLIIPFPPGGSADPLGNRVQVFVGSVTGTQAQVAAGKARAMATGHLKRVRSLPDVPTIAESIPGFTNNGWYAVFGPAGMPAPIVDKLNAEMKRAFTNAEFIKHIEALGMEPAGGTPEELRELVRSELARWTKVVRDAGIQVQGS